jgi:rRNA maturation endonuclease Nob1
MMEVKITSPSLPGGWDCYCPGCDMFFSAYKNAPKETKYCPVCGWDILIKSPEEFENAYPHYKYRRAS